MPSSNPASATTSSVPRLSVRVRWSTDPSEVTRLLKLIKRNPLWHQACFPQGITNLRHVYTTYIDIFMLFYKDDRAMMKDTERQGLVVKVEGDDGETTWVATKKFSSRVGNPVRTKIDALKKDLKAGVYTSVHGFLPSWKRWKDVPKDLRAHLKVLHPYYFRLLELAGSSPDFDYPSSPNIDKKSKPSPTPRPLSKKEIARRRGCGVVSETTTKSKGKRPATAPPSEDERMAGSGESDSDAPVTMTPSHKKPKPTIRVSGTASSTDAPVSCMSPQWDTNPRIISRLLRNIRSNPSWRQVCFSETEVAVPQAYKVYKDIFLRSFRFDPAMKDAEKKGLVEKIEGNGKKPTWVATEKFARHVHNPVRAKVSALKRDYKAGIYTPHFDQSWEDWPDVPARLLDSLEADYPYYFDLLQLMRPSSNPSRKHPLDNCPPFCSPALREKRIESARRASVQPPIHPPPRMMDICRRQAAVRVREAISPAHPSRDFLLPGTREGTPVSEIFSTVLTIVARGVKPVFLNTTPPDGIYTASTSTYFYIFSEMTR
ncbi:hypothetical protein L202_06216 [Cryptococcus amylolentus CBS 6039]|uniref:Uncharacterized protein n=1 Tax=Cryptococcus amylolentus CBS 6039 TaxID=1295533 RepID=A0A1E3HIU9_9TREE|nr:hypothetical protein L202_06216 [Cryptococcus amylolentus CBS 6039]ODN76287.1 hypothetical protein L202_06216 [Cryptococcus amylolentus CBS 6039]